MKITIEFDQGELARAAAGQAVSMAPGADTTAMVQASAQMGSGAAIDAGHAPGGVMADTIAARADVPAEIAAAAAAISAISAGPAPMLDKEGSRDGLH